MLAVYNFENIQMDLVGFNRLMEVRGKEVPHWAKKLEEKPSSQWEADDADAVYWYFVEVIEAMNEQELSSDLQGFFESFPPVWGFQYHKVMLEGETR